jgi:TonB family protein
VVIFAVIGAHVLAATLFAIPVLQRAEPGPEDAPGPPLAMVDMVITSANDEVRSPVLKPNRAHTPGKHARRAGVELAQPARAILVVNVTEEGRADKVELAESSGNARLDELAIEYARTLEWTPALVQGRASRMIIRFPVDFPATS